MKIVLFCYAKKKILRIGLTGGSAEGGKQKTREDPL